MKTYKIPVIVHEYVDLSDRGREITMPMEGEDAWDAVYKLRDLIEAERNTNHGICRLERGSKRVYVGAVKGADQGVTEVKPKQQKAKVKQSPKNNREEIVGGTTYALMYRPISFATVPKGYAKIGKHPDFPHGTVTYSEPLTDDQIESYELIRIPTEDEVADLARKIYKDLKANGWSDEDIAGNQHEIGPVVGQVIQKAKIHIRNRQTVAHEVSRLAKGQI